MNGIVFLMEEGSFSKVSDLKEDWRVALMATITERTQENKDSKFIPIVGQYDLEEASMYVHPIADILKAAKEDAPQFYLIHPTSYQAIPYPEKLDDIQKFSPDLIMVWAELTVISLEVEGL